MKILLDTSVLVAALVEEHPMHGRALSWLIRIKERADIGIVAAHTIAELYAVLTRLPFQPRISPSLAQHLIQQDVLVNCQVVVLSQQDYEAVVTHLAQVGIVGGAVYDALILYAAAKADVDRIVTLNKNDFCRIYPDLADKVSVP